MYVYCSWLLAKQNEKSYFYSSKGKMGYGNKVVPWYKEYELPVGTPQGVRYKNGKCWSRKYANKTLVIVNPTLSEQTVQLDEGLFLSYSDGRRIRKEIVLPAQSGRILLRLEEE